MAFTSPAPVSSIIISSPPSSATFSDKSLWRSQTVPIITAINFLLTRGRLPGGATDFEDGLEGGRQQASRGWQHHRSIIINSSGL
ncbi:hypothetical protein TYRP_023485 [Tyrophagus putrescentiae]|nr:hypothetical protein TYRP_023485 [Tyrophagus putrescentiae]